MACSWSWKAVIVLPYGFFRLVCLAHLRNLKRAYNRVKGGF